MASEEVSVTDFISAVCSIIAAVFGLVTLFTVIVAVRQLLTEHRAFSSGLSSQALGPWHDKVRTRRLLGLQQEIFTPTVSVPALLKANWNPQFVFPGAPSWTDGDPDPDPENNLVKASWVNFLTAIGIQPKDQDFYQMSGQPNLVNGIVPMRWEGSSLSAIASLLGFQSYERKPNSKEPMKLPMQWSGPLGWLQFREGPNGCVVEFRRRAFVADQIDSAVHESFKDVSYVPENHGFFARLWRSVNGMIIDDKKALYLGGSDKRAERRAKIHKKANERASDGLPSFDDLMNSKAGISDEKHNLPTAPTAVGTPQPVTTPPMYDTDATGMGDYSLFDDLMTVPETKDIMERLRKASTKGRKDKDRSDWEEKLDSELGELKEMLRRISEKKLGKMEVFVRCPGLLSTVIQGELANSRGLHIGNCQTYSRAYMDYDDIDHEKTPYRLGDLFMDEELLAYMKEATHFLKPDGYYFTPTQWLAQDIDEVFTHIKQICDDPKNEKALFPELKLEDWPADCSERKYLHYTMMLCNNFQHIRLHGEAYYTVGDMILIAKASRSLPRADDLVWAMLISPDLFKDLVRAFNRSAEEFKSPGGWAFLSTDVSCNGGVIDCTDLMKSCGVSKRDDDTKYATTVTTTNPPATTALLDYKVPLCSDGTYQGWQVLASFLDVLVTYFWAEKSWVTNVQSYDHVIPQTITMC